MKYFLFALITLFCFSCGHTETPEEQIKRMMDSMNAAADSIAKVQLAKEKKTQDSIAEVRGRVKTMCPELVPFFELTYRMTDLLRSDVPVDTLNMKFDRMSDSVLKMEEKILGPGFSKMDSACRRMFLDRMVEKTHEISDAVVDKLKK